MSDEVFLSLQWHITTNCNNRCKHCYMYDERTYDNEKTNTLSLKDLVKILDSLKDFEKKYNAKFIDIAISGGDPFLREDAFDFFLEAKKRDFKIIIMGNPESLNENIVKKFKDYNIFRYQMSLDGLEKTHDFFRSKGSFQRTVEKTFLLNEYDIKTNIMFTLFPTNANELIPLMNYVAKYTDASSFSFDVGCFVGEGENLSKNFTSLDLHKLFLDYFDEKIKLEKKYDIVFFEKSYFHNIIKLEKELFTPNIIKDVSFISGCSTGWFPPSILSDGTVLACRRLPMIIGKMPEESFEDIYLKSELLKKFRRRAFFQGCKDCDLYSVCRGCPANVFSLTKDPFAKNPLCFREKINKKNIERSQNDEPLLTTTKEEEWEYIKKNILFRQDCERHLQNKDFQFIYIELSQKETRKNRFLKDPLKYIKAKKYNLTEENIAFLKYILSTRHSKRYDIDKDYIAVTAAQMILEDIEKMKNC